MYNIELLQDVLRVNEEQITFKRAGNMFKRIILFRLSLFRDNETVESYILIHITRLLLLPP